MKSWTTFLLAMLVAGCATRPQLPAPPNLLNDQLFAAPTEKIDTSGLFTLNDGMRAFLEREFRGTSHLKTSQQRLFEALYAKGELRLEYDSTQTRSAADTFNARMGNCLSLVIMTAAFAKEMGMDVRYQNVLAEETWSRNGGVYFSSSHVNVSLGRRKMEQQIGVTAWDTMMTIDFLPPDEVSGHHTMQIDEATVLAMFMNNRAAEALARGELDNAYWWAREGIARYPEFFNTVNTLAVVYLKHGNALQAEQALRFAMLRDPNNPIVLNNMVPVLQALGKNEEANAMAARAASIDPHPAFQYFDQGMAAMQHGDYKTAQDLFAREVRRAPYYHEFHFWLAMASYRMGEFKNASEELALAAETSTTRTDRNRYSAKLAHLKSMR